MPTPCGSARVWRLFWEKGKVRGPRLKVIGKWSWVMEASLRGRGNG
jgi:hypothetical protein